jgi:molybdopterin-biosynthesis enzyme MoeA-like protein
MENVFVMAGVPTIMRAMLEDVATRLQGGAVVQARTVRGRGAREGDLAAPLRDLQTRFPTISLGSYPWYGGSEGMGAFGVQLVARGADIAALDAAAVELQALIRGLGIEPELVGD